MNVLQVQNFDNVDDPVKTEKDKTIKILFNDEVFEKIYLYEIDKHGMIKRYDVVWIEEIQ